MVTNIYCDIKANSAFSVTLLDDRTLGMVEVTIAYRERLLEGLTCISHHPTAEAHDTTVRTSLRLLTVLNVLFKYACARPAARASSDGPLTHFASPRGEKCRLAARVKSHAGGVTRPGTIGLTPSRSRNVAPRSPRGRAEVACNPLGDGHLRPSALSFVGGDHPDRHPPHFAPSDRRSPPRLPRDF